MKVRLVALLIAVALLSAGSSAFAEDYIITVEDLAGQPILGVAMYAKFDFGEGYGDWILGEDLNNGKYKWSDLDNVDAWIATLPTTLAPLLPAVSPHEMAGPTALLWVVVDLR